AQVQGVAPVDRVAVGVVYGAAGEQLVEVLLLVLAVAGLDPAAPDIVDAPVQPERGGAEAVLVIGRGGVGGKGVRVPAAEGVVDFVAAALVDQGETCFQRVTEFMAQAQGQRTVAVGIVVRVAGVGAAGAIDAGGFIQPGREVEAGAAVTAGEAQGALEGAVAAGSQSHIGAQALAFAAPGED